MDSRKLGECTLLLGSLCYSACHLEAGHQDFHNVNQLEKFNRWLVVEITIIVSITTLLLFSSGCRILKIAEPPTRLKALLNSRQPSGGTSPKIASSNMRDHLFIWMSVPKNYREASDDGLATGIALPILVALGLLHTSLSFSSPSSPIQSWLIEEPHNLPHSRMLCTSIFIWHGCASWWWEYRHRKNDSTAIPGDGERKSVPRGELRRSWYYVLFTFGVTAFCIVFHGVSKIVKWGFWQHLNIFDVIMVSMFYQFTLYVALRMAHRGFTLGELGLVCFGGTALAMEGLYLTIARVSSFLVGFLLSPFLFLSRHVASRPLRRLRDPQGNHRQKRFLALGFYLGALLIVGGPIGLWTKWCLGGRRDPWVWALFWILDGRRSWSRPALLGYWGLLGSISVAGWNRQLARLRRNPVRKASEHAMTGTPPSESGSEMTAAGGTFTVALPTLPNLSTDVSTAANDLLDKADRKVPTLGLNARRKFFHALAVVMFVPGIAFDPAFTHLSFSVCFALFTFTEYARYFAIYPFGASIHVFMHDFLDTKDTGTAILSHFFLLSGCAGSVWLESAKPIQNLTGVLVLGIGDAVASIVGKRAGKHRWSPSTYKTLEGSMGFVVSVTACAWLLRLCGVGGAFDLRWYLLITVFSSLFEALSEQNDNLTLPLFTWAMLAI
ncbi:hypothetical protein DL96DRAFT_1588585 [Flagelloscypha sp. PMI_526]|nr:hypothetical protein DL96DRAFT_1588585 [Flagelloscypha sp. PMI_526]